VPVATDFRKIPGVLLLNTGEPLSTFMAASFSQVHVPVLLRDDPVPSLSCPTPDQVVGPDTLRTRDDVTSLVLAPPMDIPPLALVIPAPDIVPPVQVRRPETWRVSVPPT